MWNILIADDDPVTRQILTAILKGKADVVTTADGREALDAYCGAKKQNKPFDAVLLDVRMPHVDGLEVLRQIRDEEEQAGVVFGQGVPIIVVTAYDEYFTRMFNLKCDDYILKPINAEMLIQKLAEKITYRQNAAKK